MTEEEIRAVFSKNMKTYREKQGLSQMTLANKAGLATNFINDIENGKKWISPATLSKISEALEIPPYKLFIEVDFDNKNCSKTVNQLCTELSNDFMDMVKKISVKYTAE